MIDEVRAYDTGYKQGIKDERERIIKLLSAELGITNKAVLLIEKSAEQA